jgi:hypothetical protein
MTIHLQLMPKFTMFVWRKTSVPQIRLHGVNTENFTFQVLSKQNAEFHGCLPYSAHPSLCSARRPVILSDIVREFFFFNSFIYALR